MTLSFDANELSMARRPRADWRFCVAPMMDWTDRHCRYFHRTMTKRARLYTEMVTADALLRGDAARLLAYSDIERPLALQLGGSEPEKLAEAARIGEAHGYDEINLNVGCPSDRVQSGAFGACLMKTPAIVAESVAAMIAATSLPVTVKCRLGVDDQDPVESLFTLVETVASAGCETFIVHARKAWLNGLSPKENREVPPLDYDLVRKLKRARPDLTIVLNGGIADLDQAADLLNDFDGVMLGRAAYHDPFLLAGVDARIFGEGAVCADPADTALAMVEYVERMAADGAPSHRITRHMLGLFQGRPGARQWRRTLSGSGASADVGTLAKALAAMGDAARTPELA